ncbi:MAG: histidine kinase [Eubacteriales bacterium]|nr:histidine kinase [Eubacteriales bacterium]
MNRIRDAIRNRYRNIGSFYKMTILFEIVLLASLVFILGFSVRSFSLILKEKEIALGEDRVEDLADFIQGEYNRVYSLGNYIHSGDIYQIISRINASETEAYDYKNISDMQVFFSGISYADNCISDVILISQRDTVYSYTRQASYEVNPSYLFLDDDTIKEFLDSEDSLRIIYDDPTRYCIREREPVISFMGKIYDASLFPKKNTIGLYLMNLPLSQVEQTLHFADDSSRGEIFLLNRDGQIIYSTDAAAAGNRFEEKNGSSGREVYVSAKNLGTSGLSVHYRLSEEILSSQINYIQKRINLILAAAILVTLLFSFWISQVFQKKMNLLLSSMEEVQKGNFENRLPVDSQDEIGRISQSFNEMCEKLNIYVEQVYKSEIQRKTAEINALQTQIDPHFLYNTLESIKAKALANSDEDAAEMITILGNMFRWSSRTSVKMVALEEELEYVKNYLVLQSYRYNRQMEISIDVAEEFLDAVVPKLILQPIVENVIKHALDEVDRKKLVGIHARQKGEVLELTIYDNGKGISEDKLQQICEKLNEAKTQDEFDSIGLQNVNQRLKLMFGMQYGLQIRSIEGFGTAVKIRLPFAMQDLSRE